MLGLSTRFEISTFTRYKDMKGDENAKIWVVWGSGVFRSYARGREQASFPSLSLEVGTP